MQIAAMTWVDDTKQGRKELRMLKTRLANTMESWGGMTVIENVGDPILLYQSNILGLSKVQQGTKSILPFARALELLPLTRPASAFPNGTVLHQTLDNKIMPLEKFSSKMSTWVTAIVGKPGSGKSVMLNNLLIETCLMPNLSRLPLITVIDKGISSTGFINLIYDSLPVHQRHLVVTKKLRKSKEYAINPFDIKPGLQAPLESEKSQIVTFITALLTPPEREVPYVGTTAFVSRLVDEVFLQYSESLASSTPKMYVFGTNAELDRLILQYEMVKFEKYKSFDVRGDVIEMIDQGRYEEISYLSLVRKFHVASQKYDDGSEDNINLLRARDLAQRYAVPVLSDLGAILNQPKIVSTYKNAIDTGETIVDFALRAIAEIQVNYPCFCYPTEFDVDTARIVALDLNEVISQSNKQQTSLFYQVSRMIGIKKFSLVPEDIVSFPEMFHPYYNKLLNEIKEDKKVLAIDEMHNATSDLTFITLIDKDVREGRKWGLELIFGSQQLTDFDFGRNEDSIKLLKGVTQLCVCSVPKDDELATFKYFFTDNPVVDSILSHIGLSQRGLSFLSFTVAKNNEYCSLLTLPVGTKRLWSLTTDQEERLIRDYMYDLAGSRRHAIAALAYFFKNGDAKERIRQIRSNLESKIKDKNQRDAQHSNMVLSLAKDVLSSYDSFVANQRYLDSQKAS